ALAALEGDEVARCVHAATLTAATDIDPSAGGAGGRAGHLLVAELARVDFLAGAFLAGAFLAVERGVRFLAGPWARFSASSSIARSGVVVSRVRSRGRVRLVSPSVTYG